MCVFCGVNSTNPKEVVVFEDTDTVAVVSLGQKRKNLGTILVLPRDHYENLYSIPDELLMRVQVLVKRVSLALKEALGCDGVSVRQNNEKAGDQDVFHYHVHVIPRYFSDNFRDAEVIQATFEERQSIGRKIEESLARK